MLSGAIASCIARTASKSSGQASRISTVVPSARSAYTGPVSCAVFIGVSLAENRAGDLGAAPQRRPRGDRVAEPAPGGLGESHGGGRVEGLRDGGGGGHGSEHLLSQNTGPATTG